MEKISGDKEGTLHEFVIEQLGDELEDCEEYQEHAEMAKHAGDHALATTLNAHAKDELRHFKALYEVIEKSVPNLKTNPLYPLLADLEAWAKESEEELAKFR